MVQKIKETAMQNKNVTLMVCTYFIDALIILLFSSTLYVWLPYSKASSVRTEISFTFFLTVSKRV